MDEDDVSVLIPYGFTSKWNHALMHYCMRRWRDNFPNWEIVIGSSDEPFNRSAARNDAARKASGTVFVIADADTTFETAADVLVVARLAHYPKRWFLPRRYLQTTEDWATSVIGGSGWADVDFERDYRGQPGGWRVCHRLAYETVGGFDEGFRGWGYEDTAFAQAMTATVGKPGRTGTAVHLWHPTSRSGRQEQEHIEFNRSRFSGYARNGSTGQKMQRHLSDLGVTPWR